MELIKCEMDMSWATAVWNNQKFNRVPYQTSTPKSWQTSTSRYYNRLATECTQQGSQWSLYIRLWRDWGSQRVWVVVADSCSSIGQLDWNEINFWFVLNFWYKKWAHTEIRTPTRGFRVPCATLTPYELSHIPTTLKHLFTSQQTETE